jgi:hypothetical protein
VGHDPPKGAAIEQVAASRQGLFSLPGSLPGNPMQWKNVGKDGDRFIFAMPTTAAPGAGKHSYTSRRVFLDPPRVLRSR